MQQVSSKTGHRSAGEIAKRGPKIGSAPGSEDWRFRFECGVCRHGTRVDEVLHEKHYADASKKGQRIAQPHQLVGWSKEKLNYRNRHKG